MRKRVWSWIPILCWLALWAGPASAVPIVYQYEGLVSGTLIDAPVPGEITLLRNVDDLRFSLAIEADTDDVFDAHVAGFGRTYFNDSVRASLAIGELGTIDPGPVQQQAWRGVNRVRFHSERLRAMFIGTWHDLEGDWDPTPVSLLNDDSFTSFGLRFPDGDYFTAIRFSNIEYSATVVPEPNTALLLCAGLAMLSIRRSLDIG